MNLRMRRSNRDPSIDKGSRYVAIIRRLHVLMATACYYWDDIYGSDVTPLRNDNTIN